MTERVSAVQLSRMNWAIGQGSRGGLLARRSGKCRTSTRIRSVLQSQNPVSNSRSSSGVRRSEEKAVIGGSATGADDTWRVRLAVFMAAVLRGRVG